MPSIDFDKFTEQVDLMGVVRALNITAFRFHTLYLRAQCPVCRHEDQRACKIDWEGSKWYCHRCRRGGGPIQLASHLLGCGPYEAVVKVCELLGVNVPYRERVRTRRRRQRDASGEMIGGDDDDEVD